jgi:NADH-quinone oxidoreductase subunit J
MTVEQIVFILMAILTLGAALMVVTTRNLVHAALWLVVALFGVAVYFVLLNAGFLAVAQVVIYIGAIAILMIFTIMLTRRVANESGTQLSSNWVWGMVVAVVVFVGLVWMLSGWQAFGSTAPAWNPLIDPVQLLGSALVAPNGYVLPFELASILLLAAMIGAIVIAWERK